MTANKIHIFVGDCDDGLALAARSFDSNAFLIDHCAYYKIIKSDFNHGFVAYTSLADLPKITETDSPLWTLLQLADHITYHPPAVWSDHGTVFDHWSAQRMTEFLLSEIQRQKNNVEGLNLDHYVSTEWLPVVADRSCHDRQLWVTGCSISHGVGVMPNQRYGHLLSQNLQQPVSFLTQSGSSISWAADQLLRADIQAGDTVVWGITSEYRQTSLINGHVLHRPFWSREVSDSRSICDIENFFYLGLTAVHQVRNHLDKVGAQLVLLPLLCSENIKLRLLHCAEYCPVPYAESVIDLGADHEHPGPRQHIAYADIVTEFLLHKS